MTSPTIATPFAQSGPAFMITGRFGHDATLDGVINAQESCVYGPWARYTKDQIARMRGIVTERMCNGVNKAGDPVYRFHNPVHSWDPEASIGDILLQDSENPEDTWPIKPERWNSSTGWQGFFDYHGNLLYAKPGKPGAPHWAILVPPHIRVNTLEGPYVTDEGDMLVLTGDGHSGDFYLWRSALVRASVKSYNED